MALWLGVAALAHGMAEAATIGGTINDQSGNPVAEGSVFVFDLANELRDPPVTAYIGTDGSYEVVAPNSVLLVAAHSPGHATTFHGAAGVDVTDWTRADFVIAVTGGSLPIDIRLIGASGYIEGRVTDETGSLVANAAVTAYPLISLVPRQVLTNESGAYRLGDLAPDSYYVVAQVDGKAAQYYPSADVWGAAVPVAVGASAPYPSGINFTLGQAGRIRGQVLTGDGENAIAGVVVTAFTRNQEWVQQALPTGDDGVFTLASLPLGDFVLATTSTWLAGNGGGWVDVYYPEADTFSGATPITLTADQPEKLDADFRLKAGSSIAGQVCSVAGPGIADAAVVAFASDYYTTGTYRYAVTDDSGNYVINGTRPGAYVLVALAEGYVAEFYDGVLTPDQATAIVIPDGGAQLLDKSFSLETGRSVSGKVTGPDGVAVAGGQVVAIDPQSGLERDDQTDASGNYTIAGLLAVDGYRLEARAPGYGSGAHPVPIDLTVSDQIGKDIALTDSRSLSGTVRADDGGGRHVPVAGAWVQAYSATRGGTQVAVTGNDGTYRIFDLPAANDVLVVAASAQHAPQYYDGANSPETATEVDLSAGNASDIDFALAAGRQITGAISDGAGQPVVGAGVWAYSATRRAAGWAMTGVGGEYAITGLVAAPDYLVAASAGNAATTFNPGVANPAAATLVNLDARNGEASFALINPGSISGTVQEQDRGVAGAVVFAYSGATGAGGTAETAADGTYKITGLAPAADYVAGVVADKFAAQFFQQVGSVSDATLVPVNAGADTPAVDFDLARGGRIAGRVSDGVAAVGGANVAVFDGVGGYVTQAQSGEDGTFKTIAVAPGNYTLEAMTATAVRRDVTAVAVVAGETTDVGDVVLDETLAGAISGTLTGAGGPIATEAVVFAYSDSAAAWVQSGVADGTGAYVIEGLAAGSYRLYAAAEGFAGEFYDDAADLATAMPVVVAAGGVTSGIGMELAAGGGSRRGRWSGFMANFGATTGPGAGRWYNGERIGLSWVPPQDASVSGYSLVWDSSPSTQAAPRVTLDGRADTSESPVLDADGTYYAHLRALGIVDSEPVWGDTYHAGPFLLDRTPPSAPTGAAATASDGRVQLSWESSAEDVGGSSLAEVRVTRGTDAYPTTSRDGTVIYANAQPQRGGTDGTTDTGLSNGTAYYYGLFAVDGAGNESSPVQLAATPTSVGQDVTPPASVQGLTATPVAGGVQLTWKKPASGDVGGVLLVYRTDRYPGDPNDGELAGDVKASESSAGPVVHGGLSESQTYFYAAFAYDLTGNTAGAIPGSRAQATPLPPVPVLWGTAGVAAFVLAGIMARRRRRHSAVDRGL